MDFKYFFSSLTEIGYFIEKIQGVSNTPMAISRVRQAWRGVSWVIDAWNESIASEEESDEALPHHLGQDISEAQRRRNHVRQQRDYDAERTNRAGEPLMLHEHILHKVQAGERLEAHEWFEAMRAMRATRANENNESGQTGTCHVHQAPPSSSLDEEQGVNQGPRQCNSAYL